MIKFLKLQYEMGKLTLEQLEQLVTAGRITAEEKTFITKELVSHGQ